MAEEVKAGAESQVISEEQLRKAEEYVQQEEGAANRLAGWVGVAVTGIAVTMTLFHLYAAYDIVPTQELRYIHVAFVLLLSFLLFPLASRFRNHVQWFDIIPALAGIGIIIYALAGGDDFLDRAAVPDRWDVILGGIFIVLVLEAARRTTGPIMPIVAILFIAYAMFGPYLPPPWTHRGFDVARLVGHLFITLEGIFGVAVDVSATLIIMFTIYGAILQHSGAGKFFIDFSLAVMGGKPSSAGRAVVASSFLLGGPSGSGVATTVMIGTVAWPMLKKAGFQQDAAGGLLAAGGLGAIISPPVLGAAAFLIAEFLKISYLDVIWMATIPTCLYYLSLLFMVELDAMRFGAQEVVFKQELTIWGDDQALRFPFRVAGRRRHIHGDRLFADALGFLFHHAGFHDERAGAGDRIGPAPIVDAVAGHPCHHCGDRRDSGRGNVGAGGRDPGKFSDGDFDHHRRAGVPRPDACGSARRTIKQEAHLSAG